MKTQKDIDKEIELEVMKQISLLFPLSKEPIAITSAIELTIQQTLQEVEKIIDELLIQPINTIRRLEEINNMKKIWSKELIEEYKQLGKKKIENKRIILILEELKQKIKALK